MPTEPVARHVLNELIAREPLFHRAEFGTTRADFAAMTTDDFWEVGASGQRYSREHVLNVLDERYQEDHDDPWETRDFHCRQVGLATYLLTYTLIQGERVTRRSTLWENSTGHWRAVFHQGTLVNPR